MANVQHGVAGSGVEEHGHGAENTGFLHKLKEKLHIGHKHKEEKVGDSGDHAPGMGVATPGASVVSKDDHHVAGAPVASKPVDAVAAPPPPTTTTNAAVSATPDHQEHVRPTSSDTGRESEHHGGERTFLAALPDRDIPAEDAPSHGELHHVDSSKETDQDDHPHGVVPEGGVPTFMTSLPDQDIPAEDAPEHSELHHGSHVDSKDIPHAEHHQGVVPDGGVPTFLASLPNQDFPPVDSPKHSELRHVTPGSDAPRFDSELRDHESHQGGSEGSNAVHFDSEQVFEQAQQGEHHHGVPTFLVALPDEQIPDEVTKGVESTRDDADNSAAQAPQ